MYRSTLAFKPYRILPPRQFFSEVWYCQDLTLIQMASVELAFLYLSRGERLRVHVHTLAFEYKMWCL
jgi:hypothetical protein